MSIRSRFYIALLFAIGVILVHLLSVNLYLYWTYRWVDIPMHILGGIMAGMFTGVLLMSLGIRQRAVYILTGVLLVGVGWEILELFYRVDLLNFRYWIDTVKDLIDDTIGGIISIYIWKKIPNQK